jgi:hypothetical protein
MAQLVARLVRNEKVRGSNPLSSTSTTTKALPSGRAFVVPGRVSSPPICLCTDLAGGRGVIVQVVQSMPCSGT